MKKISAVILAIGLLTTACGKSKIFTNVDFSFEKIADVFPRKFNNQNPDFVSRPKEITFKNKDEMFAAYGSDIFFAVMECENESACASNFDTLVAEIKTRNLTDYNSTRAGENKFEYKYSDRIEGLAWTNKGFLFQIEGRDRRMLASFLELANIAKIQ